MLRVSIKYFPQINSYEHVSYVDFCQIEWERERGSQNVEEDTRNARNYLKCERKLRGSKRARKSIEILNLIDCFDSIHSLASRWLGYLIPMKKGWVEIPFVGLLKYTHYVHIYTILTTTMERREKIGNLSSLYTLYMHSSRKLYSCGFIYCQKPTKNSTKKY